MLTPEEREDQLLFEARERRARSVLSRLKSCEQYLAAPRSLLSKPPDGNNIREWVMSVRWALKRCGLGGATALVIRCTRQQHSQLNSFKQMGIEMRMTRSEAEMTYIVALAFFLGELDRRRVPDDYRDWNQVAA